MRTEKPFLDEYREILAAVEPGIVPTRVAELRTLAATELCLYFLAEHLPGGMVEDVPSLLLGYPSLLGIAKQRNTAQMGRLSALRHLCSAFASAAVWQDACHQHPRWPETLRCYDLNSDGRLNLRQAAPTRVYELLARTLGNAIPWQEQEVQPAMPGEALVRLRHGGPMVLGYQIPATPALATPVQHALRVRETHPPLTISMEEMLAVAARVDAREEKDDWPANLPPLRLEGRLRKLQVQQFTDGFYHNGVFTLNGTMHLVGMLSSGKSTLVWGFLFGLMLGRAQGMRIGVLVSDTIQGASHAARLRRHGVQTTVLSSFPNREEHLRHLHWRQGLAATGVSLGRVGELTETFSVACPLDGSQIEPKILRGRLDIKGPPPVPTLREKPCHRLYPLHAEETQDGIEDDEPPDVTFNERQARSCPLWAACPAQAQQRDAVGAQVLFMTPQAFVHMQADRWTLNRRMTMAELFQFTMDLVLVDEVDSVQKSLDEIFAPRESIMGGERNHYAPAVGARTFEALRERSGGQFRREINSKWQAGFFTLCRLIGTLYGLLQNETVSLREFYANKPFTAASILYELWRRNHTVPREKGAAIRFDDPKVEKEFLDVMHVAGWLSEAHSEDDAPDGTDSPRDPRFSEAGKTLRALGDRLLATDGYYEELLPEFEQELDKGLAVFGAVSAGVTTADRRTPALAFLLAVVTGLTLSRYGWLTRAQPSVAADFGLDDPDLLNRTGDLLRKYRTLLPSNPAGGIFGLFYDAAVTDGHDTRGGTLTIINHLGVGRHLLTHLHDLLAAERQAGPHVLMLSGTSWAGGARKPAAEGHAASDAASPSYDVQVPVCGVLLQPEAELQAIGHSQFTLVRVPDHTGDQARVSGLPERERRNSLKTIANQLGRRRGEGNLLTQQWADLEVGWGKERLNDRRRVLLVVNSYTDAAAVADALTETLDEHRFKEWRVSCLVRDRGDDSGPTAPVEGAMGPRLARALPRSLVERFGQEPEFSVLVAPMGLVARGHNILNAADRAAISTVLFLHRPHPRPDDLGPLIGRLNRYAEDRFEHGMDGAAGGETDVTISARARRLRYEARALVREGLAMRQSYSELPGGGEGAVCVGSPYAAVADDWTRYPGRQPCTRRVCGPAICPAFLQG